jgi:hypothetical protein
LQAQFYPESFVLYNMCNGHVFNDHGRALLAAHIAKCVCRGRARMDAMPLYCEQLPVPWHAQDAIVMDPPFAAPPELLGHGLRTLWGMAAAEVPTILAFPYFNEDAVRAALPTLAMLDYRVDYDNHPYAYCCHAPCAPYVQSTRDLLAAPHPTRRTYRAGKGSGSPVRLYTNIALRSFTAPAPRTDKGDKGEGDEYRRCAQCDVVVAVTNRHCDPCGACTTKHGRAPYVHCTPCGRCVKPGLVHCGACMRCTPAQHACSGAGAGGTRARAACHVCGSEDHRRKECPHRAKRHKAA